LLSHYNSAYSAADNPEPKFSFIRGEAEDELDSVPATNLGG
jgi:hypothetical protein